jgi:hypothetical protein
VIKQITLTASLFALRQLGQRGRKVPSYFWLENPTRLGCLQIKLFPMQSEYSQNLGLGLFTLHSKKSGLIMRVRQTLSVLHMLNIFIVPPSVLKFFCVESAKRKKPGPNISKDIWASRLSSGDQEVFRPILADGLKLSAICLIC